MLDAVKDFNLVTGALLAGDQRKLNARSKLDEVTLMILPQVHLRKPCYDFYFL